jgi:hypothetical protein
MRKIWKRSDVDPAASYCFVLYQADSGVRDYGICRLEEVEKIKNSSDFAFITGVVPIDLVLRRDVFSIADGVPLCNGERFYFDSDAIWHLAEEWEDLRQGRKPVRWTRGLPPKRPSRHT